MDVTLSPCKLKGHINAISSKSFAHRMIISAALCSEPTHIILNTFSEDINATLKCIEALGARVKHVNDGIIITPVNRTSPPENPVLNCCESGSTARFIIPVASTFCPEFTATGSGRLPERPFSPLIYQMNLHGVTADSDKLPIHCRGILEPGKYELAGDISSQYITGLMLALPQCRGNSEIVLTSPLESSAYVDITAEVLSTFGITVEKNKSGYAITSSDYISPKETAVEGDWSNAAFWLAADMLCGGVTVDGLNPDSVQGDKAFSDVAGSDIIDAREIPDLVPILAVVACARHGRTQIINAQRLRLKESDRIKTVCSVLSSLGADISETEDGLVIVGHGSLKGGICNGFNDHRIVMSCAIASLICENSVTVHGAEAVNKSYPNFFHDFESLKIN